MYARILYPLLNVFENLRFLTGGRGGVPYTFHPEAIVKCDTDEYGSVVNAVFAGAKGSMPGFPNALVGGQKREWWGSPYRYFQSIPDVKAFAVGGDDEDGSKVKGYTSAHSGRGRSPTWEGKKSNILQDRAQYICTMASGKTRNDAVKSICDFEVDAGTRSRVLCRSSSTSRANQSNSLDNLLKSKNRLEPLYEKLKIEKNIKKSAAKNLYKVSNENFPTCALSKLMPFIVLGRESEITIYRNQDTKNPERVSLDDFIKETDGAARREYRKQFGGEYPFLTDAHVKDILDFYQCNGLLSQLRRTTLEACLA